MLTIAFKFGEVIKRLINITACLLGVQKTAGRKGNGGMKRIEFLIVMLVVIAIGLVIFWLLVGDGGLG